MSDLMNLAYARTGPKSGVLDAIARHPDATPWILWDREVQTDGPMVSAMAMIWLYELVVGQYWMEGPHPFGELIRRRRDPCRDERPRFERNGDGNYPPFYEVISELVDASIELFEACVYDFAEVGDYDGGPRITITFADQAVADAVGLPCPGDTASDGNTFGAGYPLRVYPHNAGFVRDELDAIPDLYDCAATLRPNGFGGASSEVVFVPGTPLAVVSSHDGHLVAYDLETCAPVWTAKVEGFYPHVCLERGRDVLRVAVAFESEQVFLDARTGDRVEGRMMPYGLWPRVSPGGEWVAWSSGDGPFYVAPAFNRSVWEDQEDTEGSLCWSSDLAHLAVAADTQVTVLDAKERRVVAVRPLEWSFERALSPGGRMLAHYQTGELCVVDVVSGDVLETHALGDFETVRLGWSRDGARFAVAWVASQPEVWVCDCDAMGCPVFASLQRQPLAVTAEVLEGDSGLALGQAHVASYGWEGVHVYSLHTGALLWSDGRFMLDGAEVDDAAGVVRVACTGGEEGGVLALHLATGAPCAMDPAHTRASYPVVSLERDHNITMIDAFALGAECGGALLFTGDDARAYVHDVDDRTLSVWDLKAQERLRTLDAKGAWFGSFSVSPGERFVAVEAECGVWLMRARTGDIVGCFKPQTGDHPSAPAWSPCGRWMVMAWNDSSEREGHFTVHRVGDGE